MDEVLVIGAGPAGLLAAWVARQRGAKVRVLASGIGTTHLSPGWIGVLDTAGDLQVALQAWIAAHPQHPYALTGLDALTGGIAALREICAPAGIHYAGDLSSNYRLPTALGASLPAALAPESFIAGDLRQPGAMLIAGPAGWRDFYPTLCAGNLTRQGIVAQGVTFDLPEMRAASQFDLDAPGLARLFDRPEVRAAVATQLKPRLAGATRIGLPAIVGLECHAEAWRDLQDRLGVPVFEIPTLPPSVPGLRLFNAFKASLTKAGVPILLDMTVTRSLIEDQRLAAIVPGAVRELAYRANRVVLATGGLYGGGIVSDHRGQMRETVFGLPLSVPGGLNDWFNPELLSEPAHPIHRAGVRANRQLQPVDETGRVVLEQVRVVGRTLADYAPLTEGSTEGVWLTTAFRATD